MRRPHGRERPTMTSTTTTWYEVHWARSNRADEMIALRRGHATKHGTLREALAEAATLVPTRANLVAIATEVRCVSYRAAEVQS